MFLFPSKPKKTHIFKAIERKAYAKELMHLEKERAKDLGRQRARMASARARNKRGLLSKLFVAPNLSEGQKKEGKRILNNFIDYAKQGDTAPIIQQKLKGEENAKTKANS